MDTFFTPESLVFLAGLTYVLGYLAINHVVFGLLILLGTGFYIWYYAVAAAEPLWTAIWTSLAIGASTLFGLIALIGRSSRFMIPKTHRDIYPMFHGMVPGDFRALVRMGRRYVVEQDTVITTENAPVQKLHFVTSGSMDTEKKGVAFTLPLKIFVEEVAFMIDRDSSATTVLKAGSEVIEWDVATLNRKSKRSTRFKLAFEAVISRDLALKVAYAITVKEAEP